MANDSKVLTDDEFYVIEESYYKTLNTTLDNYAQEIKDIFAPLNLINVDYDFDDENKSELFKKDDFEAIQHKLKTIIKKLRVGEMQGIHLKRRHVYSKNCKTPARIIVYVESFNINPFINTKNIDVVGDPDNYILINIE